MVFGIKEKIKTLIPKMTRQWKKSLSKLIGSDKFEQKYLWPNFKDFSWYLLWKRKVKLATDFVAKPAQIDFTDFKLDMEHGYTKKIQLTNVSYQISSIRFVSLSIALQDFCTVEFQPSGPLSPGISTSFKLTFRPALLQPISGSVTFR